MNRAERRRFFDRQNDRDSRRRAYAKKRSLRPWAENLEDRVVLSTITWNTTVAPTGGDWDTGSNWIGGVVPNATNDAVINLANPGLITHSTVAADSVLSLTTSNVNLNLTSGSIALGSGASTLGPLTVGAGATLSVANNASVGIGRSAYQTNVTLTDNGTVSFAAGDSVSFNNNDYYSGVQIIVGSGGLLQSTNATFASLVAPTPTATTTRSSSSTPAASSRPRAPPSPSARSTFGVGVVVSGRRPRTGNGFDSPLYIPAIDVQYLSNNLRFQAINIQPDTLTSGQTRGPERHRHPDHDQPPLRPPRHFTVNQGATWPSGPTSRFGIGPSAVPWRT